MTNRHNWKPGASSCILHGWKNHTEEGFALYKEGNIKYAELSVSVWTGAYEELDFYEHPEKIYEIAKHSGVCFTSFHAPFSREVSLSNPDKKARDEAYEIIVKAIRAAAKIGIKVMVLHPSCGYRECFEGTRDKYIEQIIGEVKRINDVCRTLGVVLAVENMTLEGMCHSAEEMIVLLNEFPDAMVCFDTNHSMTSSPEEYLDELIKAGMRGRIANVHISDYDLCEEKHRLPGDGKINWQKVLTKLEELDYNGVFMYEVSNPKDRDIIYTPKMVKENFDKLMSDRI